jgi:large subunit ribosomal protein L9
MNKKITKSIDLILLKTVFGLGQEGQEVKAKPGYARYLLSQQKALILTAANKELFLALQQQNRDKKEKEQQKQKELIHLLREKKEIDLYVVAGEGKKIFGRITPKKIKEELWTCHRIDVPVEAIILSDNMKVLGSYVIFVSFSSHHRHEDENTTSFMLHLKDKSQEEESKKTS